MRNQVWTMLLLAATALSPARAADELLVYSSARNR
jgi:hypothetical protein